MDWRISSGSFSFHRIEGAICSARLRGNFYSWSRQVSNLFGNWHFLTKCSSDMFSFKILKGKSSAIVGNNFLVEKNSGPADPSEIESGGSVGACLAWNTIRQLYYVQSLSFKKSQNSGWRWIGCWYTCDGSWNRSAVEGKWKKNRWDSRVSKWKTCVTWSAGGLVASVVSCGDVSVL